MTSGEQWTGGDPRRPAATIPRRSRSPANAELCRSRAEESDMRILLWHVHGSWTNNFVRGGHEYFLPVLPDRSAYGLGRGGGESWIWPENVREVTPAELRDLDFDVALLQRPEEVALVET